MSSILWKNFFLCFSNFKCTTLLPTSPSKQDSSSSLSTTTSTLIKNFNSFYDSTTSKSLSSSTDNFFSSSDDSDTDYSSTPPDFATVFASQRFFFSSPGHSNSIFHSPESPPESTAPITGGGIPIQTYSPDPYLDFRRSMQEMVEARNLSTDVADDWDFLHELLLCYLTLNPKHTHKFILDAFSDLLISLLSSTSRRKNDHRHHHATPQRLP